MQNTKKTSLFRRVWRWILYCLITLLIILMIPVAYVAWKTLGVMSELTSFQPLPMLAAQYTPKDVVGDLGGMKVRIPKGCVEYVEYDGDPGWSGPRKGPVPERNYDSKLKSFGIDLRLPDMHCKDSQEMREDYRNQFLKRNNPWVGIGINAGESYPSMGANATDGLASDLWEKTGYRTYERTPLRDIAGLEAYVAVDTYPPGKPALYPSYDIYVYIHKTTPTHVATYISCSKVRVPGGVALCKMSFGLEPKAKVRVYVSFETRRLPEWRLIQSAASELLYGFEVKNTETK